jgi:hypothetical protein
VKKNVASQSIGCQMVTALDGSAFTGAVVVRVTGDNGAQALGSVGSGACTHEGNGYHSYAPAQAETNYDHIAWTFTGTGAIPKTVQVYTSFPQTGDTFARLGAAVGASISADIAALKVVADAVKTKTDQLTFTLANKVDSSIQAAGDFAQGAADKVWASATRSLTTFGTLVADIWAAVVDSGGVGTLLSRLTAGRASNLDNLDAAVSTRLATASYTAPPSAASVATAVRTEITTELDRIDVDVSSRLATAGYTAPDNASITAIKNKTDLVVVTAGLVESHVRDLDANVIDSAALDSTAINEIADGVLDRDMSSGVDSGSTTVRTPRQALRALRNKVSIAAGTLTVTKENDATASWTAAVTTAAGDPISAVDPAGP